MKFSREPIFYILLAYTFIAAFTIFYFDGTGDSGDSITHYLFARYAPTHPALYFDHWAKPVFVLLASPFAQFGFAGVKVFNALATFFTILFSWKTAKELKLKNDFAIGIFLVCAPLYYILTFSGLTEPLFALALVLGIYFSIRKKYLAAAVIISFLPFIRSEGLILLPVFGLYFLLVKEWKIIPWLICGHVIYSIAGFFVYYDVLWVFHNNPYAHLDSVYGKGELTHFAKQLYFIFGLPSFILFSAGCIAAVIDLKKKPEINFHLLICGSFLCFFIAHSLFWYMGIFGSMGLTRVFIGVLPLAGIIMLKGFNCLGDLASSIKPVAGKMLMAALLLLVIIFPFTRAPGAVRFKTSMHLMPEQVEAKTLGQKLRDAYKPLPRVAYECPGLALSLAIDPFDPAQRCDLNPENLKTLRKGDLVIWDDHFAKLDKNITVESLQNDTTYTQFSASDIHRFAVFIKR